MPNTIVRKRSLIPGTTSELVIAAPQIAAKAKPGNFVILRVHPQGERIPLTIADADPAAGTITLVYLVLGKTTALLETLAQGEDLLDVCGPLGKPTDIRPCEGKVICVGGGTGIAAMPPPATLTFTSMRPSSLVRANACRTMACRVGRGKYSSKGRSLMRIRPLPL